MIKIFYLNENTELTAQHVTKFIDAFKLQHLPRFEKLRKYYKNENVIKQRNFKDTSKPNNKMAHPWGSYITDSMVAFFIGEPISYSGEKEDIEKLSYIFNENDEQDLNSQLETDASIYGVAYELIYLDELAEVKLTRLNPSNTICIYNDTVNTELLYVIRFNEVLNILDDKLTTFITLYSKDTIKEYKRVESGDMEFVSETQHNFEIVPVSVFRNNDDMIGDFELVIDLIDLYDKLQSDTANESDYYQDCYMVFKGAQLPEDIQTMKEERLLEIPEGGDVSFLTKNANDVEQENAKNRIVNDIHKFSKVPNMSDENFANNVSGVAMKYKLLGLENVCSIKERKFKKGLQNRLWLISNILSLKVGTALQDVKITFTRNIPNNEIEIANMINNLRGLVSNETLIDQLNFIENSSEEMEKLRLENESNTYADLFNKVADVDE